MKSFLLLHYPWIMALHVASVMAWMAAMFYLPRLYVYHAQTQAGSEASETFKVMERRLMRGIMNPAMIATFVFGITMICVNPDLLQQHWLHAKLFLVLVMSGLHGMFSKWRKVFAADKNTRPAKFYKLWNEAPPLLMLIIVILVIVKPF